MIHTYIHVICSFLLSEKEQRFGVALYSELKTA